MNKYNTIVGLEAELKQIEIDYCFAKRGRGHNHDGDTCEDLYLRRGEIIRELQRVDY
jgi:hypothetical protein